MGATGVYQSMAETKKMILRDYSFKNDLLESSVLKNASGKGGMWIFRKIIQPQIEKTFYTIDFIKMSHRNGETVYREYNFESGPCYYDCPIRWLNFIVPETKYGIEWVEKVKKIQDLKIVPGMNVKFGNREFVTINQMTNKFWCVKSISENKIYKLDKENIINYLLENIR